VTQVLADSHAILWFIDNPSKLSGSALAALREAEATDGIKVSAVTLFDLWYDVKS
jgi:PIN domain nuclease of toxin-antitoxin system